MWELAIGHNAFDRFVRPNWLSIVLPRDEFPPGVPAGPLRLAAPLLASQIGWLAPLAVAGLWFGRAWPARLLWGGWACACLIVFSAAEGIVMPYYLYRHGTAARGSGGDWGYVAAASLAHRASNHPVCGVAGLYRVGRRRYLAATG